MRLLFIAYARQAPTAQIGVLKRCLRLGAHLPQHWEQHLLSFGPPPANDPLVRQALKKVQFHGIPINGGGEEIHALMRSLQPDVVVVGEGPLDGSMRTAARVARKLNLPTIGIDNYYGAYCISVFRNFRPALDRWLLIGVQPQHERAEQAGIEDIRVIPPLIKRPRNYGSQSRDHITLLGYDRQTLEMGLELAKRLPPNQRVRAFISKRFSEVAHAKRGKRGAQVIFEGLPTEAAFYDALAHSKFVICKNGFQQIVECISLGAPVLCQSCPGGVPEDLIAPHLKPFVRYIYDINDLDQAVLGLFQWLHAPPAVALWKAYGGVESPLNHGADVLRHLIELSTRKRGTRLPEVQWSQPQA